MALTFPNPSRSYDPAQRRVRFVGHDGMFQIAFSVEVDALPKNGSATTDAESSYLAAFDKVRDSVRDVAREAYSHGRKNIYILTAADFR
jgi:hypothetical protein